MKISQEMQSQGQWLFRWRSYLPLLFLILFLPALTAFYPFESRFGELIWEISCVLIGLLGLTIRCLVIGYVPKGTSGRNTKEQVAETINTKGMYSLVRNPLYLGNFFMWLAVVLFLHVWWLAVIFLLAFALYYERIIITEEAFLSQKFGDDYEQWAAKTPAFFPRHFRWQKPDLPFSWTHILRREYHGLFGLIAAITAVEFVSDIYSHQYDVFDLAFRVVFVVSVVFYLFVRFLAKCTRLLHVEGR